VRIWFGCERAQHRRADAQGNGLAHQRHTHWAGRGRPASHGRVRAICLPHVSPTDQLPTR